MTKAGKNKKEYHVVLSILACLRRDGSITQSSEDATAGRELALLVAKVISPVEDDERT